MERAPDSDTLRLIDAGGMSLRRIDPETLCAVLARVNDLRRRSRICNLYSVGPSCGSASSLVIVVYSSDVSEPILVASFTAVASFVGGGFACCRTVGDSEGSPLGAAAQGDDTRGGSGSKVNMEAISLLHWDLEMRRCKIEFRLVRGTACSCVLSQGTHNRTKEREFVWEK